MEDRHRNSLDMPTGSATIIVKADSSSYLGPISIGIMKTVPRNIGHSPDINDRVTTYSQADNNLIPTQFPSYGYGEQRWQYIFNNIEYGVEYLIYAVANDEFVRIGQAQFHTFQLNDPMEFMLVIHPNAE
jgi:hypothetical protein